MAEIMRRRVVLGKTSLETLDNLNKLAASVGKQVMIGCKDDEGSVEAGYVIIESGEYVLHRTQDAVKEALIIGVGEEH